MVCGKLPGMTQTTTQPRVVIVGASLAGMQAAQTMRRSGFDGEIVMVGAESHYPYDRPPLSKQFLAGNWDEEKLTLRGAVDPTEHDLTWMLGQPATGLDLANRDIAIGDERVAYDGLIIATGATPRALPGVDLEGVHVLRTLDDARSLRTDLAQGEVVQPRRVCVIGAGFIGAEVAATAQQLGHQVTMVEAAEAPLARVLDLETGMAIAELHRSNGVDVRLGVGVEAIRGDGGEDGRVNQVVLSDGTTIETDVVVVGIGVIPSTEWLAESGLELDNGIVCDNTCLAAPGVVVAGDIARWPNQRYGNKMMRVEQWDNAIEQGAYAGKRLLAWLNQADSDQADSDQTVSDQVPADHSDIEPYAPVPWFWSDQYDRKIQLAGVPSKTAELVHGSLEERRFVQIYADADGAFVGAVAWNRPRHAIKARQLLIRGRTLDEAREELA